MAAVSKVTGGISCSGPGSTTLPSSSKINIAALTAGNFTSQQALVHTWYTALGNLTSGNPTGTETAISQDKSAPVVPSSTANRGQKWIVTAVNAAGQVSTYTIPAAPGAGELQADNISADLSGSNWTAYKAAFEAVATDRFGGALVLVSAKLGGRRR